jgi:adenosine deaminase
MTPSVPLAELHCHLEGTASPSLVRRLAERHGMTLPGDLFTAEDTFAWKDFLHFLEIYDVASSVIRTAADYHDVTYEYLASCAREGAIYVEVMSSPDHAETNGSSYEEHLQGIVSGIEAARRDHGIEGRLIVTCVRHFGPERALEVARKVVAAPHPLMVGFGMGGDEAAGDIADFAPAFRLVFEAGLPCTVHAGEVCGPESIRASLAALPLSRIGHGVRSAEDPALVAELAERQIPLELCPGSNVATGVYANLASHPFPDLMAAGCKVTLNSDDPPFFNTTIGYEYAEATRQFALSDQDLRAITRNAIEAAFADAETKVRLLDRINP